MDIWDFFREKCDECDSVEEAQRRYTALSGGKTVHPNTLTYLIKNALKSGEITDQEPFVKWIKKSKNNKQRRGKESIKDKFESLFPGQTFWEYLNKNFQDIEHAEGAASKLAKLTNGKIDTSSITIQRNIQSGVDAGEVTEKDCFFKWLTNTPKRNPYHMKSVQGKLFAKGHEDIYECFKESFKGVEKIEDAVSIFKKKYKVPISEPTLIKLLQEGLNEEKINPKAHYIAWIPKKRRKNQQDNKPSVAGEEYPAIPIEITCNECKHTWRSHFTDYSNHNIGFIAMRCPKCQKWANFSARGVIDGQIFYKKSFPRNPEKLKKGLKMLNFDWKEEFVDVNGKKIKCPFKEWKYPNAFKTQKQSSGVSYAERRTNKTNSQ